MEALERIERLGKRDWQEIIRLLKRGDFVYGKERIHRTRGTLTSLPHYTHYKNYEQRWWTVCFYTIVKVITSQCIELEEWGWEELPVYPYDSAQPLMKAPNVSRYLDL